jgi:uncharacterized protein (DUF1800 family)
MGIGNYTETDIKECARAFTGWTFEHAIPLYPYGHYDSKFVYREEDHDNGQKTFLGHTGNLNGEDIVDIIARQEATARFISRHLYNFFVADEQQVPAWSVTDPVDPAAIQTLMKAFKDSDADIRSVMRVLFNSDFFKAARFTRVKAPIELVAGVIKLAGTHRDVEPGLTAFDGATRVMGQTLMDPPTVEGWHTGKEWIDGGTLTERINFAVSQLSDMKKPGPSAIVRRLEELDRPHESAEVEDTILDLVGPLEVQPETRAALVDFADSVGEINFGSEESRQLSEERIGRLLRLTVASREYQFA